MTKRVFSNSMVAHVWAQQTQDRGMSANGQFYFEGDTIYSYGSHFPIARFTDAMLDGKQVVLVTSEGYSVTTAKHKSHVWRALNGLNVAVMDVPSVDPTRNEAGQHKDNLAALVKSYEAHAEVMTRVRKRVWFGWDDEHGGPLPDTCENRCNSFGPYLTAISDYCRAFELDPTAGLDLEGKQAAIRAAFAAFNDPAKVAKRAKDAGKRALKHSAAMARALAHMEGVAPPVPLAVLRTIPEHTRRSYGLPRCKWEVRGGGVWDAFARRNTYGDDRPKVTPEQWQDGNGAMTALIGLAWSTPTLVRRVGERLETSRGAEVPFAHAVAVFRKAQDCRARGVTWHRNGEQVRVGHFQLDSIDADGNISAGCHVISYDEMLRLAVREVPHMVRATFPLPALVAS